MVKWNWKNGKISHFECDKEADASSSSRIQCFAKFLKGFFLHSNDLLFFYPMA